VTRRLRLDEELVRQGLFPSREAALRAVLAGEVSTTNRRMESAGELVEPGIALHVRGHGQYVSRGGTKLAHGLDAFGVSPRGLSCLDVGCSTGGFTDCLLSRGAASVLAVDVGYAQFDWGLRHDPRVTLLERTNITDVPTPERAGTIELAVCDVSFTSVTTVLPAVLELLTPDGMFLTLVKPQFEAPRADVGEGGVVRDDAVRLQALERVANAFLEAGLGPLGACQSPVRGHKGNVEYLLFGRRGTPPTTLDLASVVRDGVTVTAGGYYTQK
jgi:23S rRNA (cytidine1920-2'-O)/16S rRNA (cytidine1409-2'-O)-methyltransferase